MIGQVFVSKVIANKLLFEPVTINRNCEAIAANYLLEVDSFRTKLKRIKVKNDSLINELKGQKKLKKPQSKALRKAKKSNKQINKELPIIAAISQKWEAALQKATLLSELLQANQAGKCFVIKTETGVYHSKKIEIIC